jgi:hypothetical protein
MIESFRFGDDSTPVACFVLGTIGGIVSRSAAKASGRLNGNSALWDDCPRFKMPAHNVVFNPRGMMPDCAAQALSDAGLIRDAYVGTMWDELKKESDGCRPRVMNESGFVKSDLSVFAAALGRLGKGKKKRMSPEAIEQRRKAGIASGFSRALNKNPF